MSASNEALACYASIASERPADEGLAPAAWPEAGPRRDLELEVSPATCDDVLTTSDGVRPCDHPSPSPSALDRCTHAPVHRAAALGHANE